MVELLKILACPRCISRPAPTEWKGPKGELELQGPPDKPVGLKCKQCGRTYVIQDGIPNLIVDDSAAG